MRKVLILVMLAAAFGLCFVKISAAQNATGSIDFTARIAPTAARPEPVRQFTFYVLTKSYAEISREVGNKNEVPTRENFIETLKVSPELKAWLKTHDIMDLAAPDTDKMISPDDVLQVPEFLAAYQRANSGGVTSGMPNPKFNSAIKEKDPEKYEKLKKDYYTALRKFIQAHPSTIAGIELELDAVNPQRKWTQLHVEQKRRVTRTAPEVAQNKYLAGKADTDLEGHGLVTGLVAGQYWISTLNLDADAGDERLGWDVPVKVQEGQTTHVQLTNLNATDSRQQTQ
ncbi:MAG TPA: hypothetical protein VN982_05255 [Candidatus Dormibacteraeota bacterium]|nr:hypothetical protein [Candidatus Dormibacteraeota bacterium]